MRRGPVGWRRLKDVSDDAQDIVDAVPDYKDASRNQDGTLRPGFTANPNGRPKKKYFRDAFIKYFEENPDALPKVIEVLAKAAQGEEQNFKGERVNHISAAQFVKETLDGKAKQELEVTGADEGPMTIKIIHEDM